MDIHSVNAADDEPAADSRDECWLSDLSDDLAFIALESEDHSTEDRPDELGCLEPTTPRDPFSLDEGEHQTVG